MSRFLRAARCSTKMASLSFILSMLLNRGSRPCLMANSLKLVLRRGARALERARHPTDRSGPPHLAVSLASSIILLKSSLACISLFFFSFLSSSALVFTYWSNTCGRADNVEPGGRRRRDDDDNN